MSESKTPGIIFSFKFEISESLLKDVMKYSATKKETRNDLPNEVPQKGEETPPPSQHSECPKEQKEEKSDEENQVNTNEVLTNLFSVFGKVCSGGTVTQEDTFKMLSSMTNAAKMTQSTSVSSGEEKWLKDLAKQVINHEPPYTA